MKCPFCGANLVENARFCLYCMTSLEEKRAIETKQNKNKRWLVILATVLVFVLVMDSIWFTRAKKQPATVSNGIFSEKKPQKIHRLTHRKIITALQTMARRLTAIPLLHKTKVKYIPIKRTILQTPQTQEPIIQARKARQPQLIKRTRQTWITILRLQRRNLQHRPSLIYTETHSTATIIQYTPI